MLNGRGRCLWRYLLHSAEFQLDSSRMSLWDIVVLEYRYINGQMTICGFIDPL